MSLKYDPIQIAIDSQLGGVFSQNASNAELIIASAIDQKYYLRNESTERILALMLEGYTQAEIGTFLGISQQHVGRLMRKIPVSDPYIVGGIKGFRQNDPELDVCQIRWRRTKHLEYSPYPDPRVWSVISEGGYLRRRCQPFDKKLEQDQAR